MSLFIHLIIIINIIPIISCNDIIEENSQSSEWSAFAASTKQHLTIQEQIKWNKMKKKLNEKHLSIISDGDIILGGLFPVHEKGDDAPCGPKVYNRGVQRLEAMMYAVDRINNDPYILPGIKIGVHILDTCSTDTYALNQSLQFIQTSIKSNMDLSAFKCGDNTKPRLRENRKIGPVMGVVGGSYSSVSMQVANLLRLFHIPQISPASTAKALSDKTRFDLFARTVPPDMFQSIALVDIVAALKWTYVSTIYSEGSYGENGIETFHKEVTERNLCIAVSEKIPTISNETIFDQIIMKLLKKPYARGVVLFTRAEDARGVLKAAQRANITNPFTWIASDAWGKQTKLVEGMDDVAEGALTVELQSRYIPEFDEYMLSLTPQTNTRNPWFEEYWEDFFSCTMIKNIGKYYQVDNNTKVCFPDFHLSETNGYEQEPKIQFVIDAVYAFAYALHKLHNDVCMKGNQRQKLNGICSAMINYDGVSLFKDYILNLSFEDIAGSEVKFDEKGDGLARYDIYNYQKIPNTNSYQYMLVGKWHKSLELNLKQIRWNKDSYLPISVCSLPCDFGMIKRKQEDTCCWTCDKCQLNEYLSDEYTCTDCGNGNLPTNDKKSCYNIPEEYININTIYGYISIIFALFGTICTIIIIIIYIKYNNTPIVRASGREFHIILLPNLLLCYFNTILLYIKPTIFICIIQRFTIPLGFSIIYSVLLVKINRLSRIFLPKIHTVTRPRFITPKTQLFIIFLLIFIEIIIIIIILLFIDIPNIIYIYPKYNKKLLICNKNNLSFLLTQCYNIILIIFCTYYAIITRKIPENFNESKYIGFTMYTTCIIWLAFIPAYFTTENTYETQLTTLSVSITLISFVTLICLYIPKLEIILLHPELNVRTSISNTGGGGGRTRQRDRQNQIINTNNDIILNNLLK